MRRWKQRWRQRWKRRWKGRWNEPKMEAEGSAATMEAQTKIFTKEKEKEPQLGLDVCKYDKGKWCQYEIILRVKLEEKLLNIRVSSLQNPCPPLSPLFEWTQIWPEIVSRQRQFSTFCAYLSFQTSFCLHCPYISYPVPLTKRYLSADRHSG